MNRNRWVCIVVTVRGYLLTFAPAASAERAWVLWTLSTRSDIDDRAWRFGGG